MLEKSLTAINEYVVEEDPAPRKRTPKPKKPDTELVSAFWAAPNEALFGQETIAPVLNKSIKTLEADRWRGKGILFRKCNGRVTYRKSDVLNWIESHELVTSTSQYSGRNGENND